MPAVTVVVVSHNSERHLERCLRSVEGRGYEVVVVDNASDDGSVSLVRRRFPTVRVVELERNLGYGAGNNVGIDATSGRYILVLNPDAWPLDQGVERLVEAMDASPRVAIVGPRLSSEDGRRERTVRGFPTVWRLATEYFFLRWLAPWTKSLNAFYGAGVDLSRSEEVDWVVGAAILVRREAFEEAGGFDPDFFMYDDEVDLAYRLHQLGWKVLHQPDARFVHLGGGSTQPRADELHREQLRSHLRFLDKHHGRTTAERGRRVLHHAMRWRRLVLAGERRRRSAAAAGWLAGRDVAALLSEDLPRPGPAGPLAPRNGQPAPDP